MNPEKGSLGQIAESLKALGIGGITEALVEEVADNCRRLPSEEFFYRTTSLLSLLGSGTTDFSTLKWSPSTNGVYAFDAEVSGLDEMYTNFLRGVSALNEEKLAFQNIQEDLSGVDQRSGAGMRRVSFDWNEASHSLEVQHAVCTGFGANYSGERHREAPLLYPRRVPGVYLLLPRPGLGRGVPTGIGLPAVCIVGGGSFARFFLFRQSWPLPYKNTLCPR